MSIELPTCQRILDAALDLFGTRVDGVSLDDRLRGRRPQADRPLLVPSKDELVDSVWRRWPPSSWW
jgi:hypothetical protein